MENSRKPNNLVYRLLELIFALILFCVFIDVTKAYTGTIEKNGDVVNFSYTATVESFTAPVEGYYKFDVWGAQGGTNNCSGSTGGKGGYSTGVYYLKVNQTVYVYVGGKGNNLHKTNPDTAYGGWNGGGGIKSTSIESSCDGYNGTGGGATDIALVYGTVTQNSSTLRYERTTESYQSRVIVAGGGGGGGDLYHVRNVPGGVGGGLSGGGARPGTQAGTNNKIGWGYLAEPGLGLGGSSNSWYLNAAVAGGGAGYYGGDQSHAWSYASQTVSTGGGSGYIGQMMDFGGYTAQTIAGNASMPSPTGGTQTGQTGHGYAKITLVKEIDIENRLESLSVEGYSLSEPFDPDVHTYDVSLAADDYRVKINAKKMSDLATLENANEYYDIVAGNSTHQILITAENGDVAIYTINFYRAPSSYQYLNGIKVNDEDISGFQPTKLSYTITVPYDKDLTNVSALYGRTSQTIYGSDDYQLNSGLNVVNIMVVSEDGTNTATYTININREHSSKLKDLILGNGDFVVTPEFESDVYEYEVSIMSSTMALKVDAIPYDEEATVATSGFGYIKSGGTAKIVVSEPNSSPTTYIVNIKKPNITSEVSYEYNYTGTVQEFTAPYTGYYRLEVWGAQGGTNSYSGSTGGYGGYSTGVYYFREGDTVYVYVGGKGNNIRGRVNDSVYGGWNGGGGITVSSKESSYDWYNGTGGGATDISLTNEPVVANSSTLRYERSEESYNSRIIVAGGGGGGGDLYWIRNVAGGSGGGYIGVGRAGGTQTGIGTGRVTFGIHANPSFGLGESINGYYRATAVVAGGGGWYGGASGRANGSVANTYGASGGSGYIASESLISYRDDVKAMYCYNCATSNNENTYTVSTNKVSSNPVSYYAKSGHGYAKITMLPQPSENNFLSSLTVKATEYESDDPVVKEYTPTYDMATEDYYVTFDDMETEVTLLAKPEDSTATIEGLGTFDVPSGTTTYEITVTAEAGNQKVYKVHVTRPANDNPYPIDISISGLVPSLCSYVPEGSEITYCDSNAVKYDKDIHTYYLTVPSRIKQLWFNVHKGHPYQEIDGEGKVTLKGGENNFTISVTSEDGNNHAVYNYVVVRDMTGNTDLDPLHVLEPERDINYDPDITEYYLSVPNNYVTYKDVATDEVDTSLTNTFQFYTKTDDENASYVVVGPKDGDNNPTLSVGMNTINILVTAANGETKTYVLNVYRMQNENVFLKKLEVSKDGTIFALNPEFNQIKTGDYRVTVPNDVTSVLITAEAEVNTTTVEGAGVKELNTGDNKFIIKTTAENANIKEQYTLIITREKNSNAYLSELHVKDDDTELLPELTFNKETLEYEINVSEGFTNVGITAVPEVNTTTYRLLDNATIRVGNNRKRVMTIAEDGTSLIYTVNIIRPASTDNTLKSLVVYDDDETFELTPEFDPDVIEYELTVENDVNYVNVLGTKNNNLASVVGNGKYSLKVGTNTIVVSVTSEDGNYKSYNIVITRKPNSNPYLSGITTSVGTISPTFDKENPDYTMTVDSNTHSIQVTGIPEVSTTKITGNGKYDLVTGNNTVTLTTLAEDGIATKTYTLVITKEKSSNNYLSNLILKEGAISPSFTKDNEEYTAVIPYSKTNANFIVTLEDERSSYEVLNNEDLIVGENEVIVKVTAQDNSTREYKVTITRLDEATSRNTRLLSLKTDQGTLVPTFDPEEMYYEVEVPYEVQNITVTAKTEVEYSSVIGTGTYSLVVGENLLKVTVTSAEGNTRDYQINVKRLANTEARLVSLNVSGADLTPTFDKDTYEYTLETTETELKFTSIVPMDSNATYVILGNNLKTLGLHEVIVRVTAANGVDTKDYKLNVTKLPSSNNNLASLAVEGFAISPSYKATTTIYTLTVPSDINTINIIATPEDINATVEGDGVQSVDVGDNYFTIKVTSENGKTREYTIIVTKQGSSNNGLNKLVVLNGTMNKEYTDSDNSYNVEIEYSEDVLDLDIELASDKASYVVVGNSDLPVGSSKVYVNVTSESGDVRTITLNVTRKEVVSALLKQLDVANYELNPTFNRYITNYSLLVNNEVDSLNMTIVPLDPDATYEVDGNESLVVGDNEITILVTASDGVTQETYTLHVTKQAFANNYLDYLYTNKGDVSPTFVKTTMKYTMDVANEVNEIELYGEAIDKSAKVEVIFNGVTTEAIKEEGKYNGELGTFALSTGENKFTIVITSTSGVKRTYYLTINRAKDSNNYLSSLSAKIGGTIYNFTPEFSKTNTGVYTLDVNKNVMAVNILATAEKETSKINGTGIKTLKGGANNYEIIVTSEDGVTRTYNVRINKEADSNRQLIELVPSSGTLMPDFNYDVDDKDDDEDMSARTYTLNLDSSVSFLSFDVITEEASATVSGHERMLVLDGESERRIVVTAENNISKTYLIKVNKERTDDAKLKNLYVIGYDFIDEDENVVTFDPDVHEYRIKVPNSKKILLREDVVATTNDKNATVNKAANLNLSTTGDNIYIVKVTAPDGFTTEEYKIYVERGKNNVSTLNNLVVNVGYLTKSFNPNVTEYTWMVPKSVELNESSTTVTLTDPNASVIKTTYLTYVVDGENNYEVKVVAEDGSNSTTYILHLELDLSADATLGSLVVDKGYYTPTFNGEIFNYDVYEYEDVEEIEVTATPTQDTSVVVSGNGKVTLSETNTVHTIRVLAEDEVTEEVYTLNIHRTIKRNETLNDLGLNGLEDLECINDKCILSPSFNSDIVSYKIKVPYEYTDLDVYYELNNDQQSVKLKIVDDYITDYELPVGKTIVKVEVYDGMNKLTKTYELEVERCKSNNTYLKKLELEGYNLEPEFNKEVMEYTVEIPYSQGDFTLEDFTAIPEFADSRVSINGYTYLQEGNNDVEIIVTASDGSTREYILHIIKASEYNSKLKNITVSTGVFWELSPKFKPTTYEYTVVIPGQYSKATVEGVPQDLATEVSGTGEYELVTGNNVVTVVGTATNGQKSTYIINIIKEPNIDVDLVSLIVEEGDISPVFDRSNTKYSVVAPEDADSLTIHATPSSREAIVTITGNNNLHSGKNIINIIVQNKDKTKSKTYQLTVNKERSSNNRLEYIKVFDDDNEYELDPEFYEYTNYYKVEVEDTIEKVSVDAKTKDSNAIITGLGEEYLDFGDNMKNIIVTAENGNVNTYYVNIYRKYNLNLKLLESDKGELDPEFDPEETEYVIELDKDQTDITFVAKAESNKVTVSGSGTYNLAPGDNPVNFVVKDPDGNEKTYSVNVKRAKDDNNYIKELSVNGILTPVFEKTVEEYTLDVHKEVKSLDLMYTLESPVATSEVIGNNNFVFGEENIVTIKVTAENGDEREYVFKVTPRPDEFFSNRLLDLTVSSGQLTPDFNPDINYYAVTVPNSTSELTITTLKENEYATVSIGGVPGGTRKVNLDVGRNVFPVVVTSQDGVSSNTYNVVIYRSQNNDATLQSLIINGVDFHPIFAKTITQYSAEIGSEVNELDITAIPTDANSKVEISGYKNLVAGENIVTIKVTAPDNETTMRYQIKVTKSVSKNNYISSLSVSGYTFDKTYIKTDQGPYTINVESGVNSIMINAIPEVDTTTITGDGKVTVNKGRNVLSVVAASESGDERTYTIIVNRAYSTDSTLKNILVSDGELDPEFNPATLEYEVEVEEEVEEITITGILNDAGANVTGNGTYDLTDGDIEVPLVVTAEDGITKTTYKVKVHRVIAASSYLKSLVVQDGELYPNFHKLITSYTILVPNEIRSLNMVYAPEDDLANVEVTGNESFKVGTNKVRISVTAKDNSSTTVYELSVVRQSKSSNYLKTLTINDYTLVPTFDKTVMYYEVTVGTDVDTINIFAEAEDPTSTVDATDLGYKTLHAGENRYYITVESASGAIRTYQLVVTKTLSGENKLLTLTSDVGEWDKEFNPEENSYVITVPIGTKKITLEGTASPNSTINGLGTSDVKVGNNTRTIVVTGQDGSVNTYTVTIKRDSSVNVNLTKLIPSVGTLSPSYDNDEENYTVTVPDNANVIEFIAETEDPNATVTGTDLTNIDYGDNEITIVVTGEDGETKKTIKVTVSRGKALESISVNPSNILIEVGESKDISYTLNPTDTTYTGVEWASEDETVATVSNGKITGVKNGSTVVKVVSTHDNTIYATVTVNVISKRITSSVYEIYRFTEEEKNATIENEEDRKVDYTVGAEPETTIEDFIKNFDNNETTLQVYDKDGYKIVDKQSIVGTGMKIKLIINDVVYDTLEIAVKGDLDGDGIVAMPDYASLKNRLLETEEYTFIKVKASDFDNDDILAMNDYNTLKNYLLGLSETLNKPRD